MSVRDEIGEKRKKQARNGRSRARWVRKRRRLLDSLNRSRGAARPPPTRASKKADARTTAGRAACALPAPPRRPRRERGARTRRKLVSHATRGGEARHDHPQVVSARCRVATRRAWARSETPLVDGRAPRFGGTEAHVRELNAARGLVGRTRAFGNDPSAGSPTETLLRLLLPLNDQV